MLLEHKTNPARAQAPESPVFEVLGLERPRDHRRWLSAWLRCAAGDPFSHPGYLLNRAGDEAFPRAAVFADGRGSHVLYAFLQRPVTRDACGNRVTGEYYDVVAPLLYGGPLLRLADGADEAAVMEEFWRCFRDWAGRESVISEFHRANPVTGWSASYPGRRREQAPHVVKSIGGRTEQELLLDASKGFRRTVRKAEEAGMTIEVDRSGERQGVFAELYYQTMQRNHADARFYYDQQFFDMMHSCFPGRVAYLFAISQGEAVSGEMLLFCGETAYSLLGGTAQAGLKSGANSFLSHRAFLYAQARGVHDYVLTGGVTNTEEDPLLRYKVSMARAGRRDYFTAEQVIDDAAYARLSTCVTETGFFPAYRSSGHTCTGGCTGERLSGLQRPAQLPAAGLPSTRLPSIQPPSGRRSSNQRPAQRPNQRPIQQGVPA